MPVTRQAVGQRDRQYWKQQKNERKIPQMKEKKRNYSRTTGTKIYGHPRFCNTDFRLMLACLNLSGVYVGKDARATMSSAPDEPEKNHGFIEPLLC